MKKIIAAILVLVIVFGLAGCNSMPKSTDSSDQLGSSNQQDEMTKEYEEFVSSTVYPLGDAIREFERLTTNAYNNPPLYGDQNWNNLIDEQIGIIEDACEEITSYELLDVPASHNDFHQLLFASMALFRESMRAFREHIEQYDPYAPTADDITRRDEAIELFESGSEQLNKAVSIAPF